MRKIGLILFGTSYEGDATTGRITKEKISAQFKLIKSAFPGAIEEFEQIDAPGEILLSFLEGLCDEARLSDYDLVVFYYYGHGLRVRVPDGTGHQTRWHHALSCARPDSTPGGGVHFEPESMRAQDFILSAQLSDRLTKLQARARVLAVVESCYAAGAIKSAHTPTASVADIARRSSHLDSLRKDLADTPSWDTGAKIFRLYASSFIHKASTGLADSLAHVSKQLGDELFWRPFGEVAQLVRLHRMSHLFPPPAREVSWPTYAGPLAQALCSPDFGPLRELDGARPIVGCEFHIQEGVEPWTVDIGSVHGAKFGTEFDATMWPSVGPKLRPLEVKLRLTEVGTTYAHAEVIGEIEIPDGIEHLIGLARLTEPGLPELPAELRGHTSLELRETNEGLSFEIRSSARHIVFATILIEVDGRKQLLNRWEPHGIAVAPNITTRVGLHWRDQLTPAITRKRIEVGKTFVHLIVTRAPVSLCHFFEPSPEVVPHEPVPSEPRPPLLYKDDGAGYVYIKRPLVITPAVAHYRLDQQRPKIEWTELRWDSPNIGHLLPWREHIKQSQTRDDGSGVVRLIITEIQERSHAGPKTQLHMTLWNETYLRTAVVTDQSELSRAIHDAHERDPADGDIPHVLASLLDSGAALEPVNFQIIGSASLVEIWTSARASRAVTDFRDLPWELLTLGGDYAMRGREVLRRIFRPGHKGDDAEGPLPDLLRVMFMPAEPRTRELLDLSNAQHYPPLNLEAEEHALEVAARGGRLALHVEVSGSLEGLRAQQEGLEAAKLDPAVVHISCHGRAIDGSHLCLEARREVRPLSMAKGQGLNGVTDGSPDLRYFTTKSFGEVADAEQIGANINLQGRSIFVSSCNSGGRNLGTTLAAELVCAGARAAIGWAGPIGDVVASAFATSFYRALARGASLEDAIRGARSQLSYNSMFAGQWHLPRLYLAADGGGPLIDPSQAKPTLGQDTQPKLRHQIGIARPELDHMVADYNLGLSTDRRLIQMIVRLVRAPTIPNGLVLHCKHSYTSAHAQRQIAHRLGWVLGEHNCVMLDGRTRRASLAQRLGLTCEANEALDFKGYFERNHRPILLVWSNLDQCLEKGKLTIETFDLFDELMRAIRQTRSFKAVLLTSQPVGYRYPEGRHLAENFVFTSTFERR